MRGMHHGGCPDRNRRMDRPEDKCSFGYGEERRVGCVGRLVIGGTVKCRPAMGLRQLRSEMVVIEYLVNVLSPRSAGPKPKVSYIFLKVDNPPAPPLRGAAEIGITSPLVGDTSGVIPWPSMDLDQSSEEEMTLSCGNQATRLPGGFVDELMAEVAAPLAPPHSCSSHRRSPETHARQCTRQGHAGDRGPAAVGGAEAALTHARSHR